MIFPDVTLDEWVKRFPALAVTKKPCHFCRQPRIANIPFIDANWAGLMSLDCSCGKGKGISISTPKPATELVVKADQWFKSV